MSEHHPRYDYNKMPERSRYAEEENDPRYSPEWRDEMIQDQGLPEKPWIQDDPMNPCREWRETGHHCLRCPYDPVCNN